MPGVGRLLILGGTGEARRLAAELAGLSGLAVVSSLAGRVRAPALPQGEVRLGGFGGALGLARWLRAEHVTAVVDATHPFAARMTANAAVASEATGVPLLVLRRPGWTAGPGDVWRRVGPLDTPDEAEAALAGCGDRVFLATGRGHLAPFASLDRWFLLRSVDPPQPPLPRRRHVVLDRGPFTVDGERALLAEHRIDVVVTRDSGGTMAAAKLAAARDAGIPVLLQRRPPLPPGVEEAATVAGAIAWVERLLS